MSEITRNDVQEVVEAVLEAKIEPFARMVQSEFAEQRRYFDEKLQEAQLQLKDDIHYIHETLNVIVRDLQEIRGELSKVVYRHELEAAVKRIDELEQRVAAIRGAR